MKNAHLRMGTLQFTKVTRETTIDVRLHLDRLIAEHDPDTQSARCHLLSVFGNDQEIAAIAAALSEEGRFYVTGLDIHRLMVTVGTSPAVYRSSISVPGRRRPLRHLIALSEELAKTSPGGNHSARCTVLCDDDPAFVLFRLGARFGLPVLPEWSEWFSSELQRRKAIEPLVGIGCKPAIVKGTKKRFLAWIGHGLKRGVIHIPADPEHVLWRVPDRVGPVDEESPKNAP